MGSDQAKAAAVLEEAMIVVACNDDEEEEAACRASIQETRDMAAGSSFKDMLRTGN